MFRLFRRRREIEPSEARAKVAAYIAKHPCPARHWWEIRDEDTEFRDGFWLFSWSLYSEERPSEVCGPTVGNNPIAVRKRDGVMIMFNLLCSWEEFLMRVRSGDPHPYGYILKPR